ncbi:hypothetical protein, partial [Sphingobacterium hotanense]
KANQAREDAISAAANDATNKANTAKTEAIAQANQFATDAINAITIGGRNLVWHSDVDVYSEAYLIKHYSLTEDIKFGETYTITIWGNIAVDRFFGLWDESSSAHQCVIYKVADGVYRATWVPSEWFGNKKVFAIYQLPNDLGSFVSATINKIKVEKGNKGTDWTPAPEDVSDSIEVLRTETQQSFSVMDGKIEGKVNQTDLNSLGQTVANQGTLISQNAQAIDLRATKQEFTELNNSVGAISGRVTNAEAAIQVNSDQIELRAVKTVVDAQIDSVNGRVDSNVSRIAAAELKITPEAINLTVKSQTESIAAQKLNDLKIGGRNLLLNSSFILGAWKWNFDANVTHILENDSIILSFDGTAYPNAGMYQFINGIVPNTEYYLSFETQAIFQESTIIRIGFENYDFRTVQLGTSPTEWNKIELVLTSGSAPSSAPFVIKP